MSAWDVVGAVFWSLLAAAGWVDCLGRKGGRDSDTTDSLITLGYSAAAVFCIARVCGVPA